MSTRWTAFVSASFLVAVGVAFLFAPSLGWAGGPVTIVKPVAFAPGADIREAVVNECQLETKVADYVEQAARGDYSVSFASNASGAQGRVLTLKVENVDEQGASWFNRRASVTISGELRENGRTIGTLNARRTTMGGPFGGWMGACARLHRCTKSLGNDVVDWMDEPAMGVQRKN